MRHYFWNFCIALDILVNTIFGGDPRQTVSARVYRYRNGNWCARLVYQLLDWIQPGHCEAAYTADCAGTDGDNAVLK